MEISKKIDSLLYEKEILPIMKLEEKSLSDFLEEEPDIYMLKDLKKRYRWKVKNVGDVITKVKFLR